MTEDDIQQHVVKMMNAHKRPGVLMLAVANGEKRSPATGAKLKRQGVRAGAADLVFCIDGHFIGLELKTETGHLSEAQLQFAQDTIDAQGEYYVAYGLDEAMRRLQAIGALRSNVKLTFPNSPAQDRIRDVKPTARSRKKEK